MTIVHKKPSFWVVTMISNPVRYSSRYRLYRQFEEEMSKAGVNLFTVEVQHGQRNFVITRQGQANALQLRTTSEIWHKENALNLGVQRLPDDWEYVAWIDADVTFQRPDWIEETLHQLQHYKIVQMFQSAIDLGPEGESLQIHNGFVWSYLEGKPFGKSYEFWHPGFAWACTREAWDGMGGLLDRPVCGAADHHMATSLIGRAESSFPAQVTLGYKQDILHWQERAEKAIKRDIGYVPGTLFHHWHGAKKKRYYVERWQILIDNKFDPNTDICKDAQGLYRLTGNKPKLRDDLRRYFRARREDEMSND